MNNFDAAPPIVSLPDAPPPTSTAHRVLQGPLGLRAGWGIALYIVLFAVLSYGFIAGAIRISGKGPMIRAQRKEATAAAAEAKRLHRIPEPQPTRLSFATAAESAQTAAVLLAGVLLAYLERRRFAVYGLGRRHVRDLVPGALWGLVAMGVLVGALRALHLLAFDGQLLHGPRVVGFGLGWLVFFLLVGLFEEFLFRGYLQFTLMRGLLALGAKVSAEHARAAAFWMAATIWSVLFFVAHIGNAGENPVGLVSVFTAGIVLSYALWRTGSLWWGVGFHMTWDWSQSFLYGVPDSGTIAVSRLFATHAVGKPALSGGVDGPEGSLLGLCAFVLMIFLIRMRPQAAQPPVEPEVSSGVPPPAALGGIA